MKKNLLLVYAGVLLCIAVGLGVWIALTPEGPPDNQTGLLPPLKGFRAEMLTDAHSPGALVFIKTCAQCHDLPSPRLHTKEEWPAVVIRMLDRLIRRKTFSVERKPLYLPDDAHYALLIGYLSEQGLKKAPDRIVSDRSAAALLFKSRCMQCHALPDPALYRPSAWPAVIERMQQHAVALKRIPILDTEKETLISFFSTFTTGTPVEPVPPGTPISRRGNGP